MLICLDNHIPSAKPSQFIVQGIPIKSEGLPFSTKSLFPTSPAALNSFFEEACRMCSDGYPSVLPLT
jgi:hypothetical protein